jgi:hypothetical protein
MELDLAVFSEDELIELNHRIIDRLHSLQQQRRLRQMARFNPGDAVSFSPEPGRTILGKVIRANAKTITVIASSGQRWRVAPQFLGHTVEAGAGRTERLGNVIRLHPKRP